MISTRQLIFIISIVFFFVNRATSGSPRSSNAPYQHLLNEEVNPNIVQVNSEHLRYCKLELTTPFQKAKPFDNFLHALLYLNTADFLVRRTYTKAAYEYFEDLLSTELDQSHQPKIENPEKYCKHHHRDQCGIAKIGCQRKDSGLNCFQKVYLEWKKDESIVYSTPYYGYNERHESIDISDEKLANALSRGTDRYPGLSCEEVSIHLTDTNLLEEFYAENEDRRGLINDLKRKNDESLNNHHEAIVEQSRAPSSESDFIFEIAQKIYFDALTKYIDQRAKDIRDARNNCYGIKSESYKTLLDEYNRRQTIYNLFGDSYAMYLHDQLQLFGRYMGLDSEDNKIFKDPKTFCTRFLINNLDYYDWMNR